MPEPEDLSIRYSHPAPLIALLREACSSDAELEALLTCDNTPAPLYLQCNTVRTDEGPAGAAGGSLRSPARRTRGCGLPDGHRRGRSCRPGVLPGGPLLRAGPGGKACRPVRRAPARDARFRLLRRPRRQELRRCHRDGKYRQHHKLRYSREKSKTASPRARPGWAFPPSLPGRWTPARPSRIGSGRWTPSYAMCPAPAWASSAKSRISAIRTWRRRCAAPAAAGDLGKSGPRPPRRRAALQHVYDPPRENAGVMAAFLADHPEFFPEPLALPAGIAEDAPGWSRCCPISTGPMAFISVNSGEHCERNDQITHPAAAEAGAAGPWGSRASGSSRSSPGCTRGVRSFDEMTDLPKGPAGAAGRAV